MVLRTAIDGDNGADANNAAGWVKCAVSAVRTSSMHWLAIDLEGLFFVSKVRATFRYDKGQNVAVFVGNNPFVPNGRYECSVEIGCPMTTACTSLVYVCMPTGKVGITRQHTKDSGPVHSDM